VRVNCVELVYSINCIKYMADTPCEVACQVIHVRSHGVCEYVTGMLICIYMGCYG
jgi:hypothetical protein